jgi:hypothetical protein
MYILQLNFKNLSLLFQFFMLFCPIPTPIQCHWHCHYLIVSTVLPEICKTQLPFSFYGLCNSAVLQSSSRVYEGILSIYLLYRVTLVAPW